MYCHICGSMNMVDIYALEERPHSSVITLLGFYCDNCGGWETVSVSTAALDDLYTRIARAKVGSTKFQRLMAKAVRKAENLVEEVKRERHGESQHKN